MGGYWAYKTLGWGGYWGWDPVENASFIPWLFGTVLIHGLYMERTKGRFRRANYVFAFLTYISVLYGTFLTRSGVLADFSVHSFVDLGISGWLTLLLGGFIAARALPAGHPLAGDPDRAQRGPVPVARHLPGAGDDHHPGRRPGDHRRHLGAAADQVHGEPEPGRPQLLQPGEPADRDAGRPPARRSSPTSPGRGSRRARSLRKMSGPPPSSPWRWRWRRRSGRSATPSTCSSSSSRRLALATNLQKTVEKFRAGGLKATGGYLAHVGVGVILLGIIASSGYDQSTKVTLTPGGPPPGGRHDAHLHARFIPRQGREKERMEIQVARAGGKPFMVYPKMFMNDRTRQMMVNPDIKSSPFQDLYVSPIEFDPGQPRLQLAKGQTGQDRRRRGALRPASTSTWTATPWWRCSRAGRSRSAPSWRSPRGGGPSTSTPVYRLNPGERRGRVAALALPGGGAVFVSGINASSGAVQLETTGIGNPRSCRSTSPASR